MIFNSPERVATLTSMYPGERGDDGRPRVPDDILERMRLVTTAIAVIATQGSSTGISRGQKRVPSGVYG